LILIQETGFSLVQAVQPGPDAHSAFYSVGSGRCINLITRLQLMCG